MIKKKKKEILDGNAWSIALYIYIFFVVIALNKQLLYLLCQSGVY